MPSSENYVRDYKREYATAKARGEIGTGHDSSNAKRHRLRRKALKLGMIKKSETLDHIVPLSKGGGNTLRNARGASAHDNYSYPRNSDGSMRSNT